MATEDPWEGMNSAYFKFNEVGDTITGQVIARGRGTDFNGKEVPELTLRTVDGTELVVTCSQANLKHRILELRPALWSTVKITYTRDEKAEKGTAKKFDVHVKAGVAPEEEEAEAF